MRVLLALSLLLVSAICKEHHSFEDDHFADGKHNSEFDHQAILGSRSLNEEFADLSEEESKIRLDKIVKKMDLNSDGSISKEELSEWVINSFKSLDKEDAAGKLKEQDGDGDGKVSWDEYLMSVYNFKQSDLADMDKDKNDQVRQYADMVKSDSQKFNLADENKDGILEGEEFFAFTLPWNYERMEIFEVQQTLKEHDKNGDNMIDLKEYLGDSDRDKETEVIDRDNFMLYDKDGDKQLNQNEIRNWVIPDYQTAAHDEAVHLIEHSDLDGDGKLLRQEILDKVDLWVGSAVTDFGRTFHDEL